MSGARSQRGAGWQEAGGDIPGCSHGSRHPRTPVMGEGPVPWLALSPQQPAEGLLPLPATGGNPLPPCYRQLSAAIFQLCAFKELIGGEIILSR